MKEITVYSLEILLIAIAITNEEAARFIPVVFFLELLTEAFILTIVVLLTRDFILDGLTHNNPKNEMLLSKIHDIFKESTKSSLLAKIGNGLIIVVLLISGWYVSIIFKLLSSILRFTVKLTIKNFMETTNADIGKT